jgi:hypothetical protein
LLVGLALFGMVSHVAAIATAPRISVQYSEKITIVGSTFTSQGSMTITAPTVGLDTYVTDFTTLGNGAITRFALFGSVDTNKCSTGGTRVIAVTSVVGVTSYKFPGGKVTYSTKKGFSVARISFDRSFNFSYLAGYIDFLNNGFLGLTAPRGITTGMYGFPGYYHALGGSAGFPLAITIDYGLVKSLGTCDNPACIKVKVKNGKMQAEVSGGGDWFYP